MRKFLKNCLLFSCLTLTYLTFVFAFNFYNENHPKIPRANILFLGDSHIKYHVNPDSFVNAYNYGHSGDIIKGQEWKINKLLQNQIDTIIIPLGYHTFREKYPDFFEPNEPISKKLISRYLFINPAYFFTCSRISKLKLLNQVFQKIKKPNFELPYLGYYIENHGIHKDSSNSAIDRHYGPTRNFNKNIITIIYDIISICSKNNIKCFFIFPPTHPTYISRVPLEIKAGTDEFMNQFSQTPYFIPVEVALDDSLFFDGDHLNAQGAKIYTHSLKQALYSNKKHSDAKL